MSNRSKRQQRLTRVAELQSLKALASAGDYSAALADSQRAQAMLQQCEQGVQSQAGRVDAALSGDAFDFDHWRIGRAVLDSLATTRDTAATDAAQTSEREGSSRHQWHCEQQRERRIAERCKAVNRRLADKRDEAAASEAVGLRQSLARRKS
jgi:hypothetical protein